MQMHNHTDLDYSKINICNCKFPCCGRAEPLAEAAAAADSSNYCRAGSATVLQVRCFSQLSSSAMLFSSFMETLDSSIVLGFALRFCSSTILCLVKTAVISSGLVVIFSQFMDTFECPLGNAQLFLNFLHVLAAVTITSPFSIQYHLSQTDARKKGPGLETQGGSHLQNTGFPIASP